MDDQETIRVGITDKGWYDFLRHRDCSSGVNFWRPSKANLKIEPGEWLLFKMRSAGKVVGGARFLASELLTINQAWSRWGPANGCADKDAFLLRLIKTPSPLCPGAEGSFLHPLPLLGQACLLERKELV